MGEFEGEGETFFQKGPPSPSSLLFLLFSFHVGQQLADAVQAGGCRILEAGVELVADDAFQRIGQPGEEAVGQGLGLRHGIKAAQGLALHAAVDIFRRD